MTKVEYCLIKQKIEKDFMILKQSLKKWLNQWEPKDVIPQIVPLNKSWTAPDGSMWQSKESYEDSINRYNIFDRENGTAYYKVDEEVYRDKYDYIASKVEYRNKRIDEIFED